MRTLPDWQDRLRYRTEFAAELHGLPPAAQLRYTVGVLSLILTLRAALGSSPTRAEEAAMTSTMTRRRFFWRCQVLRRHRWVARSTDDGGRCTTCLRCGRDWFGNSSASTGGFAAGGSFGI